MSVLNRIAYLQNRRDEVPNQELARELAEQKDRAGIHEIAENLWCLVVQRELVGFIHENLRFVRERFDIPAAAIARMGRSDRPAAHHIE